jgi:hypothetical protein
MKEFMSDTLPNPKEITRYLQDAGYKVSQSTVYKHKGEGRIPAQKDGTFLVTDVDRYASLHLKPLDGSKHTEATEELQKKKLAAETLKAQAQAKHWDMKTNVDSGQYIDRDLFDGELAARATIFKNDLETFIRSNAGDIIRKVDGDVGKSPDLIDYWLERLDVFLGRYSVPKKWPIPLIKTTGVIVK